MAKKQQYARTESARVVRTMGLDSTPAKNTYSKKSKKKKRRRGVKAVIAVLLVLILGIAGFGGYYGVTLYHQLKDNSLDADKSDLGIDYEDALLNDKDNSSITNIALFGVDQRDGEQCRSDAIMIMSVDKKHNKIKVASVMRDSYVAVEGHGMTKICHAYYYGGPALAIKTLNQTFGLNIQEYVTVNFNELAQIVDAVGGVNITIKEKEIYYLNKNLREQAKYDDFTAKEYYVSAEGKQRLNGQQAVAYARIRKSDSDFIRTDRQRTVLRQLFNEALSMNPLRYPEFAKQFLGVCDTSLDLNDCISLAGIMVRKPEFVDLRLPLDEDLIDGNYYVNGVSYVYYDTAATSEKLRDFIYNDVIPGKEEENSSGLDSAPAQ